MGRVVLGVWAARYPLGGILSWNLQWAVGTARLGHEVVVVEKAGWDNDLCYDPVREVMTDDCSYGVGVVAELLAAHGIGEWCFVDPHGNYFGMSRERVEELIAGANVYVDIGAHGAWLEEASRAGARVVVDGEPGYRQVRMLQGYELGDFDLCFTTGVCIATGTSTAPNAGREWRAVVDPVVCDLFEATEPPPDAPFTTIMNWAAHEDLVHEGRRLGQKDAAFPGFIDLPTRTERPLELAVGGPEVPSEELESHGWQVDYGPRVTRTYEEFKRYIARSAGEFVVPKEVFVALWTGCFSDRSAAYLASGRPVVMQDTGFSDYLPTGEGLFAVRDAEEAAAAIAAIDAEPERHRRRAREIAEEFLDTDRVLRGFYSELGL